MAASVVGVDALDVPASTTVWTIPFSNIVPAVGDIIAYSVSDDPQVDGLRVIHRVIGGNASEGYQTQGDNRETPDPWRPVPADILGRKVFRLPKLGIVLQALKTPLAFAILAVLWGAVLFWAAEFWAAGA